MSSSLSDRVRPVLEVSQNNSPAIDPLSSSRIPSGKPPVPPKKPDLLSKNPLTPNTKIEHPEWMSFSEKKKHFEKANAVTTNSTGTTTTMTSSRSEEMFTSHLKSMDNMQIDEVKKFSYLSQNELKNLREEEEEKLSKYSEEQIRTMMTHDVLNDSDYSPINNGGTKIVKENYESNETVTNDDNGGGGQRRIFRTAKAEKRYMEKMSALGIDVKSEEYSNLTPAQLRALEAEKRKEWRQARLKSLEDDTMRTMISARDSYNEFFDGQQTTITHEEEEFFDKDDH